MVKNNISENGTPESFGLNKEDDVLGQKKIERENILKGKVEIREGSAFLLDELKANIDRKKDSLDTLFSSETKNKNTPPQSSKRDKEYFSAFSSFDTRRKSDIGKGLFRGVFDSAVVFGGVIGDLGKDAFELAAHPIYTTQNAVILLKKQDPNIEII